MESTTEDDVIALIYEAASGHAGWPEALEAVRVILDCFVVQIVGVDMRRGHFLFSFESDDGAPEATLDYARTYHRMDPHAAYVASGAPGQLIAFSSVFTQAYVDKSPFYQDFLIPYGSRHMHGAKLHEAEGVAIMLGIHRGVGKQPLEGSDWLAAQRICFHLTRAAKVLATTRKVAAGGAIARDLLNRLRMPVYLIEGNRHLVMRNDSSLAGTHVRGPLRVTAEGVLECSCAEVDQKITQALSGLNQPPSIASNQPMSRRMVARIKQVGGTGDHLLCLDAIRPNETMSAFGQQPLLLITQHPLGMGVQLDPFFLASAFDLTPAEAFVASATAYGLSQKEIAKRKGVSLHTVHTQLKCIHLKLGVRKSTELVALLHSVSSSLPTN